MRGGDPEYALGYEQAVALLPDGETVHTLLDGGLTLIGADWDREAVLALLRDGRPERSGDMATAMGHGLVAFRGDGYGSPVFIATRDAP